MPVHSGRFAGRRPCRRVVPCSGGSVPAWLWSLLLQAFQLVVEDDPREAVEGQVGAFGDLTEWVAVLRINPVPSPSDGFVGGVVVCLGDTVSHNSGHRLRGHHGPRPRCPLQARLVAQGPGTGKATSR